jgi:transcriptional regulator with XRE-family HTH domain
VALEIASGLWEDSSRNLDPGGSMRAPGKFPEIDDAKREQLGIEIRRVRKLLDLSQEDLGGEAEIDPKTIGKAEKGETVSDESLAKICSFLKIEPAEYSRKDCAPDELGGYSIASARKYEGQYLCVRPLVSRPGSINAYKVIFYLDDENCLLRFREENRGDIKKSNSGKVCIPEEPLISLFSIDRGLIRIMTLGRPDDDFVMRGISLTLKKPTPSTYIPTASPVVLKKLTDPDTMQFGCIGRGSDGFNEYLELLKSVTKHHGTFSNL